MFEKNIVASLGILGNSLEAGNSKYYNFLKDLIKSNYFEIWNHGYKHIVGGISDDGTVFQNFKKLVMIISFMRSTEQNFCAINTWVILL
ncbi:MAG: hypothetical protein IPK06_16160 [Ignavibacteriae bacterium]|nr:hypothetical protein [Ignavibacteriota bacterium]